MIAQTLSDRKADALRKPEPTIEPDNALNAAMNAAAGFTAENLAAMVVDPLPAMPTATEGMFQTMTGYGYAHAIVRSWEWSNTFGRYGASVTFDDGTQGYTWPAPEAKNAQPSYAAIPAIGGGSHEADTQPRKQRTAATTQKRDNQRAQRAALNEAYKAHAAGKASEVSDILTAFGFAIISEKDNDGTPVTIWRDTNPQEIEGTNPDHIAHATIKQTPYSLRIYNGQPARLPRHGDAELINRVEHGWCIGPTEPRGYAAGLADAILRLIEVPEPLMDAIDAMEAREAEQSAPELTPEEAAYLASIADLPPVILPPYVVLHNHQRRVQCARCNDKVQTFTQLTAGSFAGESICLHCADILTAPDDDEPEAIEEAANAYTLATPSHEGGLQTIISASHHTIPNPVLIGGQPSTSGPWELPAISGGSQELCDECGTAPAVEQGLCRHCFDTHPGYCVKGCGRLVTTHIKQSEIVTLGYCDECAPCQHDADEPPTDYRYVDSSPLDAGAALIAEANRCIKNAYACVLRHADMHVDTKNAIVNDANALLPAARAIAMATTDQRDTTEGDEMDRIMECLRILHHCGLSIPAGLIPAMSERGILRAWYDFQRMLKHDKITSAITFEGMETTLTSHSIIIARKIARNATACGLTNSATVHQTQKGKPAIFRERWQDGRKIGTSY